ncbi:MAG: class I mannose-6-phosphate isomerase [Bacteroidales bacterium]|nr:class I mannose-6-phosphate isomerase [Bacteroidales bacterium]
METPLYTLRFSPWFRTMVWGGERILPWKGVSGNLPKIGESWEISGYGEHLTLVDNGPLRGHSTIWLGSVYKEQLLGKHVYKEYGDQFPLLIKFIDAHSDLSIQVHPDDEMAKRVHGPEFRGKTEMWYVIAAAPGAALYCGLSRDVTREEYQQRVADGTITDILARYEVQPGDVFFLPPGRIHAICSGCLLAEIQQTSDLTYRIWDYGRPGLDGKPRQLHTELALQAIDFRVLPTYKTSYQPLKDTPVELVKCKYFTTTLYDLTRPFDVPTDDSFLTVICVQGSGLVDGEHIHAGETLLVPACRIAASCIPSSEGLKLLVSRC